MGLLQLKGVHSGMVGATFHPPVALRHLVLTEKELEVQERAGKIDNEAPSVLGPSRSLHSSLQVCEGLPIPPFPSYIRAIDMWYLLQTPRDFVHPEHELKLYLKVTGALRMI